MANSFNDRLLASILRAKSHLCVGLDPDPRRFTPELREAASRMLREPQVSPPAFDTGIRTTLGHAVAFLTHTCAAAVKVNTAFFESAPTGIETLKHLRHFIGQLDSALVTICDAKRGDIGNSSEKYAEAIFSHLDYDAVTINPLMGTDSVEPFLRDSERGAFLLCLTSNPGASDFLLQNELYKRIAERAVNWNTQNNVGLVVGATRPQYAAEIRSIAPELPFLIPGVGAQGGALAESLDAIDAKNNPRFLVSASRSIMFPQHAPGEHYADAVTAAAQKLRDEINAHIQKQEPTQ
jgi:orotidine 5'-phosphate decarboxylase subfamily 2